MNLAATIGFQNNPSSKEQTDYGSREFDNHSNREEVVCFDFDGVLSESKGPYTRGHFGPPVREGINLLKLALAHGFRPVVLTARKETDLVQLWLAQLGFQNIMVVNHKVPALAYIDDRALHFDTDSATAMDIFKKLLKRIKKNKPI
jgi:hypothetical protein